jgi:multidrug efflux pump subunit AcrA (membrane-fusion protein)
VALAEAVIRAPFGGVIQARNVDEGSQIGPSVPALSLVETSKREAHIGIPEGAVASLEIGRFYTIKWQNTDAKARLRSILPEVNPNTRTTTAVFILQEQNIPLGAVVELSLRERIPGKGYWVPIGALTAMDRGLWGLFIIDGENTIQRRLVEVVHNEGERAFVRGLLSSNDRVVAAGVQRVVAGQRVIPVRTQRTAYAN